MDGTFLCRVTDSELYIILQESTLSSLVFFGFLCLLIVGSFLVFQLSLLAQNVTTNETSKWEDLENVFNAGRKLVIRRPKLETQQPSSPQSNKRSKSPVKDEAIDQVADEWEEIQIESYDDLENIYRDGWLQNLMEAMRPAMLSSVQSSVNGQSSKKQKKT